MTDVSQVQAQRFKEAESKRFSMEIKKLRTENYRTYQKEVKNNEAMLSRMRQEYEQKVKTLEGELEKKLIEVRNKQKMALAEENKRLNQELNNLQKAHQDQLSEIKIGQDKDIEDMQVSHKNTLENARQKFLREKQKWEVPT